MIPQDLKALAQAVYDEHTDVEGFDPAVNFMMGLVLSKDASIISLCGEFDKLSEAFEAEPEVVPQELIDLMHRYRDEKRTFVLIMYPFDDSRVVLLDDEYGSVGDEVV